MHPDDPPDVADRLDATVVTALVFLHSARLALAGTGHHGLAADVDAVLARLAPTPAEVLAARAPAQLAGEVAAAARQAVRDLGRRPANRVARFL